MSELLFLLDDVLGLQGRAHSFTADTPLLGALPDLDSTAVIDLIAALEQRWGLRVADDEIDGRTF
ncbi:MAG: acyl carrier protein, partial [Betaproteobacteria bacterium]